MDEALSGLVLWTLSYPIILVLTVAGACAVALWIVAAVVLALRALWRRLRAPRFMRRRIRPCACAGCPVQVPLWSRPFCSRCVREGCWLPPRVDH